MNRQRLRKRMTAQRLPDLLHWIDGVLVANVDLRVPRPDGTGALRLNITPPETVARETGVEIAQLDVLGQLQAAGAIPSDVAVDISGASDQLP